MAVYFAGDEIVDGFVADIMDLLDFMDEIDAVEITPPPPPRLVRQYGGPLHPVEVIDLTSDSPDWSSIPVATRLDFSIVVDELDHGGLFGAARAHRR